MVTLGVESSTSFHSTSFWVYRTLHRPGLRYSKMTSSTHPPSGTVQTRYRGVGGKVKESSVSGNVAYIHHPTIRLKVVIRHLPSDLKESEFRDAMSNYIKDESIDFFTWNQGKTPKEFVFLQLVAVFPVADTFPDYSRNKPATPSRCYLKIKNPKQVTELSSALRSHGKFIDSRGNSTLPQMEFSPFQKIPQKTVRIDSRAGTIESDTDFRAFLVSLNPTTATAEGSAEGFQQPPYDPHTPAPIPANDPLSVPLPWNEPIEKPKTTPLIEYIRSRKTGPEKQSSKPKAAERATSGSGSRSAKRAERRTGEKASTSKTKQKDASEESKSIEPMALLKRMDSGLPLVAHQGSSGLPVSTPKPGEKFADTNIIENKESGDTGMCRDRDRRRSGISGVAAILHRDLGLGSSTRRSRGRAVVTPPDSESTAAAVSSFSTLSVQSTLGTNRPQLPESPRRQRGDRPSRRERRAAKLEREESMASKTGITSSPASTTQLALPRSSGLPAGRAVMLMKHEFGMAESSSVAYSANASPSSNTNTSTTSHNSVVSSIPATPTGPRGGFRGGRGRNRGGMMAARNRTPPQPQPQATPSPPSGPAAGSGSTGGDVFGARGRGGRGGVRGSTLFARGRNRAGGVRVPPATSSTTADVGQVMGM